MGEEEDGRDVVAVLEDYKRAWADKIKEFQLQRRIVGVEVATGAFFNGREFVTPICVNFEHKKLFPGDIGPPTGEMGTSMFWSEPNKIFTATLEKMAPRLAARALRRLHRRQLHRERQRHLSRSSSPRASAIPPSRSSRKGLLTPMSELFYKLAEGTLTRLRARERLPGRACAWWCRRSRTGTGRPSRARPRTR